MQNNLFLFGLFLAFGIFSFKQGYEYAVKKVTEKTSVFLYGFLNDKLGWNEERIQKEFIDYTVTYVKNNRK